MKDISFCIPLEDGGALTKRDSHRNSALAFIL